MLDLWPRGVYFASRQTFRQRNKLTRPQEFTQVLSAGERILGKFLQVCRYSNALEVPRLGMIIPKKVVSKAVERNRIKRMAREMFRRNRLILGNYDYVIKLRAKGRVQALRRELAEALSRHSNESITRFIN